MAYLTATRYGLTHVEPTEEQRESGWRQVWRHSSGLLAMRHPSTGYWVVSSLGSLGWGVEDGFSSSLRAVARRIERLAVRRRANEILQAEWGITVDEGGLWGGIIGNAVAQARRELKVSR